MTKEQEDHWQELMNSAYAKWRLVKDMTYSQFLDSLDSGKEKAAVLLGNFNYQVNNGGVQQWIDNQYVCGINDLSVVLKSMETENALAIHDTLNKFIDEHVVMPENPKDFSHDTDYWNRDDFDNDDEFDEYIDGKCDAFDTWYYSIAAKFQDEAVEFLTRPSF